jgi:O-acetyl-ADP-ribose deacetylase (regulator of RNase III)
MKSISGDLIHLAKKGEFDLIVHGCNCFCTMAAGIAKGIKAAFEADQATDSGDHSNLESSFLRSLSDFFESARIFPDKI